MNIKTIEEEIKAQKLQFQSNCRAIEMTCQAYGISNEKYYKMLVNKETVDDVNAYDYKTMLKF